MLSGPENRGPGPCGLICTQGKKASTTELQNAVFYPEFMHMLISALVL